MNSFKTVRKNPKKISLFFLSVAAFMFLARTQPSQAQQSNIGLWGTINQVEFKYQNPSNLKYFLDFSMIRFPNRFNKEEKEQAISDSEKAIDLAFNQWSNATKDTKGSATNMPNVPVMSRKSDAVAGRKIRELTEHEIKGLKQLYGDNFDVNYKKTEKREEANVIVTFIDKLPSKDESDIGFWDSGKLKSGEKFADKTHTIFLENLPNNDEWLYTTDSNKDGVINNQDLYFLGSTDLYTVIKHEIGHDLGFDHPLDEKSGRGCPGVCVVIVPEPTFTLGFLALGAASALKRKLKPSQSLEKEAEID